MKNAICFLVSLITLMAIDAFAYDDIQNHNLRQPWVFWRADGTKIESGETIVGIYDGADTSDTQNRVIFSYSSSCTCYVAADTTVSADSLSGSKMLRAGIYDIWLKTGADSILESNVWFDGLIAPHGYIDSASVRQDAIDGGHIEDESISSSEVYGLGGEDIGSREIVHDNLAYDSVYYINMLADGDSSLFEYFLGVDDSLDLIIFKNIDWNMLGNAVKDAIAAGAGGGGGDVYGVGVLNSLLKVDADSMGGTPHLGVVIETPAGADTFVTWDGSGGFKMRSGDGAGGGSGDLTEVKVGPGLIVSSGTGPIPKVKVDSLAVLDLGNSGAAGSIDLYDGSTKKTTVITSPTLGSNTSFYLPNTTGSTNAIYQKTGTGAQMTLSPSGLTSLSATTLYGQSKVVAMAKGELEMRDISGNYQAFDADTLDHNQLFRMPTIDGVANDVLMLNAVSGSNPTLLQHEYSKVLWDMLDGAVQDSIQAGGGGTGDLTGIAQGTGMTITSGGGPVPTVAFRTTYGDSTYVNEAQANAISSGMIATGAVADSTKIAASAVTTTRIASNAVYSDDIKDGQIKLADLAVNSVDSTKVAAGTLALSDLKSTSAAAANEVLSATSTGVMNWQPLADGQLPATITIGTGESIDVSGTGHIDATMVNVQARAVSGTIPAGSVVYAASYNPSGWLEVGLADANGTGTMPAIGIAEVQLTTGTGGSVITNGIIGGQDTDPGAIGPIFVSETAGAWTTTLPSTVGTEVQELGYIVRVHNSSGEILVNPIDTDEMQNLESAKIWVGNASNRPTAVAMSSDATMSNTGAVTIAANAVGAAELAAGAVADSTEIGNGAVTTTKIAGNAVYSDDIKDGQVKTADVAASAIDSSKVATGAITARTIKANDSPANDEVLAFTAGDLYWTPAGSGDITGVGTSNDFLKVDADSASGNPNLGLYVTDSPSGADSFLVSTGNNLRFSRGTSGGDQVSVNTTATTDPDLDDALPAAPSGGVNVKWQTSSNNVSAYLDYNTAHIDAMRTKPWYFDDMLGAGNSSMKLWPWSVTALSSGTLAAVEGTTNHPGIESATSSTSSNSGMEMRSYNSTSNIFGGGECFEAEVMFKRLKDVTFVGGFSDSWSGATAENMNDGAAVYFNTDSLLTLRCGENGTRADADTTYTVARDTWYRIRVCTTSDGNRVDGWCWNEGGTLLWHESLTDNGSTILIPDDTGRGFGHGVSVVHESTTGSIVLLWVDYLAQWYNNRALTR